MDEETVKTTLRTTKALSSEIDKAAALESISKNELLIKSFKLYQDYKYSKEKASFLNENILDMVRGLTDRMEMKINHKSNQLLSELCIELCIMEQVLAASIQVDIESVAEYRKNAVEFLKTNQRVFRMDEII